MLFIYFTSRPFVASASSVAGGDAPSSLEPSNSSKLHNTDCASVGVGAEAMSAPSLHPSLSHRLRNSGILKGGQSPMFLSGSTGGGHRGRGGFEPAEPSSPKFTCIGQVRVKGGKRTAKHTFVAVLASAPPVTTVTGPRARTRAGCTRSRSTSARRSRHSAPTAAARSASRPSSPTTRSMPPRGIVRNRSMWTVSAHMITTVIGSGMLSLAWSTTQLGWVAGPSAMLVFAAMMALQSTLFADCYWPRLSPAPAAAPLRRACSPPRAVGRARG
ncbi:unnamed protein product [Urochloa humidicola]